MKEIVKVLLQEGIDEETIHEILSVIEENYEIVDETLEDQIKKKYPITAREHEVKTVGGKKVYVKSPRKHMRSARGERLGSKIASYEEDRIINQQKGNSLNNYTPKNIQNAAFDYALDHIDAPSTIFNRMTKKDAGERRTDLRRPENPYQPNWYDGKSDRQAVKDSIRRHYKKEGKKS